MSESDHLTREELGGLEELPAGHRARRHAESCARCRAALLAFRDFAGPPHDVDEVELASARTRLHAALAGELDREVRAASGEPEAASRARAAASARDSRSGPGPPPGRDARSRDTWAWLRHPSPALAAAASLVVVGALWIGFGPGPWRATPERYRDGGEVGEGLRTEPPESGSAGEIVLRWSRVPGADSYEVLLLSTALDVVERHATTDTTLALPATVTRTSQPAAWWQVVARRDGALLRESPPTELVAGP